MAFASTFEVGDIIMQRDAFKGGGGVIQVMTLSPYNHVGVVVKKNGQLMVLEAIGRVRYTPIQTYIQRGEGYKVLRMRKELSAKQKAELSKQARQYVGKRYDAALSWSDNKLYCSELVYKVYEDIGISLQIKRPLWLHGFSPLIPFAKKAVQSDRLDIPALYKNGVRDMKGRSPVVTPGDINLSIRLKTVRDL
jgi:hypothetical protein